MSKMLKTDTLSVEIINTPSLNIKPCTGCFGCNNGEFKCVLKDDLDMLKEKIASANALIIISPCYIFSSPSIMKSIMDRSAAWGLNAIEDGKIPLIALA